MVCDRAPATNRTDRSEAGGSWTWQVLCPVGEWEGTASPDRLPSVVLSAKAAPRAAAPTVDEDPA